MASFDEQIRQAKNILIPGIGCESFAEKVYKDLDPTKTVLTHIRTDFFANGELRIQVAPESSTHSLIRNKHIYFIATGSAHHKFSINDVIMQTLGVLDACQRSDVKSITLIWLLFPYSRSDKKTISREPIMASMLVGFVERNPKLRRIVTLDVHSGQIQGFSSCRPIDNFYANDFLQKKIRSIVHEKYSDCPLILVSPDTGSVRRTKDYLRDLSDFSLENVIIAKTRSYTENNIVEASSISDADKIKLFNKTAIIIDDMIDTAGTIISTVNLLKDANVTRVIVVATHGLLSGPAIERINTCDDITDVIVTDTIDQTDHLSQCPKLHVVSVAPLISMFMNRVFTGHTLSQLYTSSQ